MCAARAYAIRCGSVRGCCPVFDVERRLDFGSVILVSRVHLRARARAQRCVQRLRVEHESVHGMNDGMAARAFAMAPEGASGDTRLDESTGGALTASFNIMEKMRAREAKTQSSSRLWEVIHDWFIIQACVCCGLIALTGYFTFISTSVWRKCTHGFDVEFRNALGREEVVRSFLQCTFGREHGDVYRPWRMGDFSVLFVRTSTLAYFGEVIFHQLSAWHASKYRKWRTKLAVYSFAAYYVVYFVMISILGNHSQYSQFVCMSCFGVLFYCGATSKEFWSTKGLSWIYTYIILMAIIGKAVVEMFIIIAADPNVSVTLKLGVRFVLDPLFWEFVRAVERHYARLNPSPGPCLQLPYFVSFTLQQAFFSRYIMFLLSAGGAVKNMATVQAVLSLHELMINVVQKDRDVHLAKLFLGKQTAEAMLISRKQHDIVALNSIVSSFAEICAVIVISLYLYVFRMASIGNEDIVDLKAYGIQALNLIAIEVLLSFFIMYAQQRFHGIRHRDVFPRGNFAGKGKWFCVTYRFVVFMWITVMMAHKITIYLVGSQFHKYLCPRINDDGSIFSYQCTTEDLKLAPGGFYLNSRAFLIQMYDFPVSNLVKETSR